MLLVDAGHALVGGAVQQVQALVADGGLLGGHEHRQVPGSEHSAFLLGCGTECPLRELT